MSPAPSRKLVLAVRDPGLRARLETLLRARAVEVEYAPELPRGSADLAADVVVLRAGALEKGELQALIDADGGDGPGVVVLDDDAAADEEVRLVAAGATAVLDTSGPREALAEQLVELAEAEVAGGLHGPEAGGSVAEPKLADFQSRSPRMRDFLAMVRRVADSESTLLVTGETGVGKERLARAIHGESKRAGGPFVAVNCGALPENLLESELFGHARGAFTGATEARRGHFEAAGGGTILLDEVGEIPTHLQVKLLAVLQRHEVQPLGASAPVPVDVRVIAATNRDLAADIRAGRFREDLYFRLDVISLVIPPLRERTEDLPWLVGRFLRHFASVHERPGVAGVEPDALDALCAYDWPGNVRELVNVVERAVLLSPAERIRLSDLPETVRRGGLPAHEGVAEPPPEFLELPLQDAKRHVVEQFERRYLEHHLRETDGTVGEVASRARINPRTLYEKMRRLGLRKEDFRR